MLKGEVTKAVNNSGVELFFFPHHAHTIRDVFQKKEEADRTIEQSGKECMGQGKPTDH